MQVKLLLNLNRQQKRTDNWTVKTAITIERERERENITSSFLNLKQELHIQIFVSVKLLSLWKQTKSVISGSYFDPLQSYCLILKICFWNGAVTDTKQPLAKWQDRHVHAWSVVCWDHETKVTVQRKSILSNGIREKLNHAQLIEGTKGHLKELTFWDWAFSFLF